MNDRSPNPRAHAEHSHARHEFRIRRAEAAGPAVTAAAPLPIEHVEFIQSVQDHKNSVTLTAGKETLVRVYLDTSSLPTGVQLRGELGVRGQNGGEVFFPAMESIATGVSQQGALEDRRHRLDGSMNFLLPPSAASGRKAIRVSRLEGPGGTQLGAVDKVFKANFVRCAPLRVRAIGLQYKYQGKTYAPSADDFASLRSFLMRAYPSAVVEWSHLVVEADFKAPFNDFTAVRANAQLAALRNRDVSDKDGPRIDPRTHYYGLVSDAGGLHFMRGRANAIPETPSPDAVASGPAGVEKLPDGREASYAGWYGAHELAHTFGRYHPGFPPLDDKGNGQDRSDDDFPYPGGSLTTPQEGYVAFDPGDSGVNASRRVIPGNLCFDIMTYLDNLWVSAYTLEAIRERLNAENELGA